MAGNKEGPRECSLCVSLRRNVENSKKGKNRKKIPIKGIKIGRNLFLITEEKFFVKIGQVFDVKFSNAFLVELHKKAAGF